MKALLKIDSGLYDDLMAHLLPGGSEREQAAFLFALPKSSDHRMVFEIVEARKLGPDDFVVQESDHLEMAGTTRAALIKRAHDLQASLVEMHSHLGPWPASFSYSDHMGLRETVPHMWWRLQKRPYLALVVTRANFDALVWIENAKMPGALDALVVGDRVLKPTNLSLEGWYAPDR